MKDLIHSNSPLVPSCHLSEYHTDLQNHMQTIQAELEVKFTVSSKNQQVTKFINGKFEVGKRKKIKAVIFT